MAVRLVSAAISSITQVSTAPRCHEPKKSVLPPTRMIRSARCINPTLQSMPSDSALARV